MKLEKNENFIGVVTGLGSNGEGIIRHENTTFFVPYCLPEETVEVKILKVKGGIGYGKIEKIIEPSKSRITPVCPVFTKCGGCQLQHLEYSEQLKFKRELVADNLRKIGGINCEIKETVPSENSFEYRNKLQMPVGVDKDGNNVIGFFAERSHRIIPVNECFIQPKWCKDFISAILLYMSENGIKGYDEVQKSGLIRYVVVRQLDNKFIVSIIATKNKLPNEDGLIEKLSGVFGTFTVWINVNKGDSNVIFGDEFRLIYGNGYFDAEEKGIVYEAGPVTFVQVNADVRGKMYDKAIESVAKDGDEVVIDAYSGGGLMTAMVAKKTKRVYGIELEPEAVKCADELKKKNSLDNMTNICGYVEEKIFDVLKKERNEKLRLILDPPRAGIHRSVLKALIEAKVERLTIISCNPSTLARDLGILTGSLYETETGELKKSEVINGAYEIISVEPYDMFPQTKHIEAMTMLRRKEG